MAGACCRSHLQNYRGIVLLGPMKASGRGDEKGGMDQPVQGPWHGQFMSLAEFFFSYNHEWWPFLSSWIVQLPLSLLLIGLSKGCVVIT